MSNFGWLNLVRQKQDNYHYYINNGLHLAIFLKPNGGYCAYYLSNIFHNMWNLKIGEYHWYSLIFPSFSWGILSNMTHLDQSCVSEDISWIMRVDINSTALLHATSLQQVCTNWFVQITPTFSPPNHRFELHETICLVHLS